MQTGREKQGGVSYVARAVWCRLSRSFLNSPPVRPTACFDWRLTVLHHLAPADFKSAVQAGDMVQPM
eukprot:4471286-Pyramimonas_sp.AAC.1